MKYLLTGTEMAEADSATSEVIGIPSIVLMERAALSVFEEINLYILFRKSCVLVSGNIFGIGSCSLRTNNVLFEVDSLVFLMKVFDFAV